MKRLMPGEYFYRLGFMAGGGANSPFGHCGPSEYDKRVIKKLEDRFIVEYEIKKRS